MAQTAYEQVVTLTERLNRCRHEYYNLNAPTISDQEYDKLFDELTRLEQVTGIQMANSPTQTVAIPRSVNCQKPPTAFLCFRWTKRSAAPPFWTSLGISSFC